MFRPKGPICQSRSMPISKDPKGGGTEADGSTTKEFCSYCYQGGKFTEPDITVEQMQVKVKGILKEMKMPGFLAGYFTKDIPKLRRWQVR